MMEPQSPDNVIRCSETAPNALICVVGVNTFKNELLADFLRNRTAMTCHCMHIDNFKSAIDLAADPTTLIFLDSTGLALADLWSLLTLNRTSSRDRCLLVLDHVDSSWRMEHQAINIGVRGILYKHQDIKLYPKVVRVILNGELWYPRKALEESLLADYTQPLIDYKKKLLLTMREIQIITMLASGLGNQNIAEKLCISPHTVKTHAYNIYKKINVTNRLKAVQWLFDED